jgi:hypothetical protein
MVTLWALKAVIVLPASVSCQAMSRPTGAFDAMTPSLVLLKRPNLLPVRTSQRTVRTCLSHPQGKGERETPRYYAALRTESLNIQL